MKVLTKLLLLLISLSSFIKAETIYTDLLNFAELTSKFNNIVIVTDESIDGANYYFIYQKETNLSLSMFRKMLEAKGLYLYKKDNFYYITDKKLPDYDLRRIELNNYVIDDIKGIMNQFDVNATYSITSNSVFFRADDYIYDQIKQNVKHIDKALEQVQFKLTITETNLKDIKDMGTNLAALLKPINRGDLKYYINLITSPYITNSNIIKDNNTDFFGVLNFLESNGLTKIISSPFLTAKNHTEAYFSTVQNIPYLVSKTEISNAQKEKSDSYEYKDVGLKVKIKPIILKDHIDFDLHLILEDLLSNNTLTPITSKKELKSSYSLKRGDVLVLSGINKTTTQKQRNGVPFLKDIFILKYLFSVEQDQELSTVLTLTIQVI
ncbi:type II secretion system protein GspD [Campylobacter sp. CCUG 57310]|uniref:type II secretion system protein GspD n=1 Tax=Campylobacter sp. CCUG 57310 TaxID=2517362 RepID=UPI001566CB0E|nr:type II and III secretion system protein [Campylobacter sp. CCUG 57310]QKF91752.1 type II secretion system protein D [Campylobacter sp. CCUG 57310]